MSSRFHTCLPFLSFSDNEAGKKLYCGMAFSLSLELCTAIFQSYLKQLESNGENMAATPLVPPALGPQPPRETSSKDSPRSDQDSSSSLSASPSLCDLDSTAFLLPAVKLWFDWLERQQDFWTSFLPGVDRKTLYECSALCLWLENGCLLRSFFSLSLTTHFCTHTHTPSYTCPLYIDSVPLCVRALKEVRFGTQFSCF